MVSCVEPTTSSKLSLGMDSRKALPTCPLLVSVNTRHGRLAPPKATMEEPAKTPRSPAVRHAKDPRYTLRPVSHKTRIVPWPFFSFRTREFTSLHFFLRVAGEARYGARRYRGAAQPRQYLRGPHPAPPLASPPPAAPPPRARSLFPVRPGACSSVGASGALEPSCMVVDLGPHAATCHAGRAF